MPENKKNTEPRLAAIGARIRELRSSAGYTSHEVFAWEKGLNRVQYWRMENGCNMTMTTFLRICDIFGVTPEDFFKGISLSDIHR
ncbi:helix-turn-helix transcriptional regulator [Millionella massiliensis]|uniref:helix-turn-helix transcriptional regulator n=1 Tax=Millionella massiliensis TaxID=1871023 RepID=UPI003C6D5220